MSTSVSQPLASESIASRAITPSPSIAIGAGALLLALMVVIFFDFFQRQVLFAWSQPSDWGHTLIIPAVSGYFIWMRREELARLQPFQQSWWGLVPVALGVGWYMLCVFGPKPLFHHNIMSAGVACTIFGAAWLLFGTAAMRWLWFPISFLWVFGQTLSEVLMSKVTFQLQDIAAYGAYVLLTVMGTEVDRSGNTLMVWSDGIGYPLNVAEACSGMRMLVAFMALGVFLAYTSLRLPWQRVLLVALGIPIALIVNIVRVASMGIITQYDQNFVDGEMHEFIGILWLLPGMFLFMGTLWCIRNLTVDPAGQAHEV